MFHSQFGAQFSAVLIAMFPLLARRCLGGELFVSSAPFLFSGDLFFAHNRGNAPALPRYAKGENFAGKLPRGGISSAPGNFIEGKKSKSMWIRSGIRSLGTFFSGHNRGLGMKNFRLSPSFGEGEGGEGRKWYAYSSAL